MQGIPSLNDNIRRKIAELARESGHCVCVHYGLKKAKEWIRSAIFVENWSFHILVIFTGYYLWSKNIFCRKSILDLGGKTCKFHESRDEDEDHTIQSIE